MTSPSTYLDHLKANLAELKQHLEALETATIQAFGTEGGRLTDEKSRALDALWREIQMLEKIITYLSKMPK